MKEIMQAIFEDCLKKLENSMTSVHTKNFEA